MPIQQMLLGVGGKKKTYMDDVFSTYLYKGNETARAINNGINLSGEGGLVWVKSRNDTHDNHLVDTVRGANDILESNTNDAEATIANRITGFNSNGFNLGSAGQVNGTSTYKYSSWSFRRAKGFFDVVTYTGNGSNRTISHSLGSIPGMIIIKRTDTASNWAVYHRGFNGGVNPEHYVNFLDTADGETSHAASWNNSPPTSSVFHVGTHARVNGNGGTFVAYLFAGGESTAATARSVEFDGDNQSLNIPDNDAWYIETNYTAECWFKCEEHNPSGWNAIFGQWQNNGANATNSWILEYVGSDLRFYYLTNGATSTAHKSLGNVSLNQWHHFAFCKSGSSTRLFVDGTQVLTFDIGTMQNGTGEFTIGGDVAGDGHFKGQISNVRITKGQALYTSSFKVATEPLTTTSQGATASNVKLLCCNNSSPTGSTVTPGTITNNNGSEARTDSPFDDPAGFVFGENEDQNVIKCGSYIGNSGTQEIDIGWEPQWVLVKRTDAGGYGWMIADSMRGIQSYGGAGSAAYLEAQGNGSEIVMGSNARLGISPKGIYFESVSSGISNYNGATYFYMAIRRPDGYVGKPAEAGTDVFHMLNGTQTNSPPWFKPTDFDVDFAFTRNTGISDDFPTGSRLTGKSRMYTNYTNAASDNGNFLWDYSRGWNGYTGSESGYQAWMFKRHAGMDVVTYHGTGATAEFAHSLNQTPEMVIIKPKTQNITWTVFHSGLSANTKKLELDSTASESNSGFTWSPTSTHFNVNNYWEYNRADYPYLALLFSSVTGISKVGSYTGTGSDQTITTGFQPRFVFIKRADSGENGFVLDTTRGWGSGNDNYLIVESTAAQASADFGNPVSTGFFVKGTSSGTNTNNVNYVYYAHA